MTGTTQSVCNPMKGSERGVNEDLEMKTVEEYGTRVCKQPTPESSFAGWDGTKQAHWLLSRRGKVKTFLQLNLPPKFGISQNALACFWGNGIPALYIPTSSLESFETKIIMWITHNNKILLDIVWLTSNHFIRINISNNYVDIQLSRLYKSYHL